MNVNVDVSIPLEVAQVLDRRLRKLRDEAREELASTEAAMHSAAPKEAALRRRKELTALLARLTDRNITRVAVMLGVDALAKLKDAAVLDQILTTGLTRGRPKHAA